MTRFGFQNSKPVVNAAHAAQPVSYPVLLTVFFMLFQTVGCGSTKLRAPPREAKEGVRAWTWVVAVEDDVLRPKVKLCWTGGRARRLLANTKAAQKTISVVRYAGRSLVGDEKGWVLPKAKTQQPACVDYRLDWGWTALRYQDPDLALTVGDDVIVGADMLFLRPSPTLAGASGRVAFVMGPGLDVSAPFLPTGDGFRAVPRTTFTRKGYVALGRFEVQRLPVAGGRLELAVLDVGLDLAPGVVSRWAYEAGRASAQMYGELAANLVQVLVTAPPVATGGSPVLFGYATRGGGAGIHVVMDQGAEESELIGEWVAVHELAHHGLPYVRRGDRWISEGMATYYQTVLRARAGLLDHEQAWADLLQGIRTASVESQNSYRYLYWGGAAGALRVDLELRILSEGRWSLDKALSELRRRRRLSAEFTADEVTRALDTITGLDRFQAWSTDRNAGRDFADFEEVFRLLGVSAGRTGIAELEKAAPWAAAREAIMAPVLR